MLVLSLFPGSELFEAKLMRSYYDSLEALPAGNGETQRRMAEMGDKELIRNVAEKVMGWMIGRYESAYFDSYSDKDGFGQGPVQHWRPLDSWNHAMEVVAAMRAKGCPFELRDFDAAFTEVRFGDHTIACDTEDAVQRRAILLCALMAVEGRK